MLDGLYNRKVICTVALVEKILKIYVSYIACITARKTCLKVYWERGQSREIIQP